MNFYELKEFAHIRTVPVMEELEGVLLLNQAHSMQLLSNSGASSNKNNKSNSKLNVHVLVTAGAAGVLKFFKVELTGKDVNSFEITPLLHFSLSTLNAHRTAPTSINNNNSTSTAEAATLQGILSLHYLPITQEIMSVTKDYNLCSYSM